MPEVNHDLPPLPNGDDDDDSDDSDDHGDGASASIAVDVTDVVTTAVLASEAPPVDSPRVSRPVAPLSKSERLLVETQHFRDAAQLLSGARPYREESMQWYIDELTKNGYFVVDNAVFAAVYGSEWVAAQVDVGLRYVTDVRRGVHRRRERRRARADAADYYGDSDSDADDDAAEAAADNELLTLAMAIEFRGARLKASASRDVHLTTAGVCFGADFVITAEVRCPLK
jgi:hypothetical protein